MYKVQKTFTVSAAHSLKLNYNSPCQNLHGHNWKITVYCRSEQLNECGMVIDFAEIKRKIHDIMDHKNLNELFDFNPTAENIAKWIVVGLPLCYKAVVEESENNIASYEV